jgi:hypothetical protein
MIAAAERARRTPTGELQGFHNRDIRHGNAAWSAVLFQGRAAVEITQEVISGRRRRAAHDSSCFETAPEPD